MEARPLYRILGVPTDATPEEIRKAYRVLALKYHPDKAGPESAETFQQVLAAYTLLSDPEAREVYDRYGEQGLSNLESVPVMAEVAHSMCAILFFRVAFGVMAALCACIFSTCLLIALKVDHHKDWSWTTVAAPAYVAAFIVFCATLISMKLRLKKTMEWYRNAKAGKCSSATDNSHSNGSNETTTTPPQRQNSDKPPGTPFTTASDADASIKQACQLNKFVILQQVTFWVRHLSVCLFLVTFSLASIQCNEAFNGRPVRLSWWAVFCPAICAAVLSVVNVGQFKDMLRLRGVHEMCNVMLFILNVIGFAMFGCLVTQMIVVPLALTDIIESEAMIIGLPSMVYLVLRCLRGIILEIARVRGLNRFDARQDPLKRNLCAATSLTDGLPSSPTGPSSTPPEDSNNNRNPSSVATTSEVEPPADTAVPSAPFDEWARYKAPSFILQIVFEITVHTLLLCSLTMCISRANGFDISMTAALAPLYVALAILFFVFMSLYVCFAYYVSTVKSDEKQRKKEEERERRAELRRARREDKRREEEEMRGFFGGRGFARTASQHFSFGGNTTQGATSAVGSQSGSWGSPAGEALAADGQPSPNSHQFSLFPRFFNESGPVGVSVPMGSCGGGRRGGASSPNQQQRASRHNHHQQHSHHNHQSGDAFPGLQLQPISSHRGSFSARHLQNTTTTYVGTPAGHPSDCTATPHSTRRRSSGGQLRGGGRPQRSPSDDEGRSSGSESDVEGAGYDYNYDHAYGTQRQSTRGAAVAPTEPDDKWNETDEGYELPAHRGKGQRANNSTSSYVQYNSRNEMNGNAPAALADGYGSDKAVDDIGEGRRQEHPAAFGSAVRVQMESDPLTVPQSHHQNTLQQQQLSRGSGPTAGPQNLYFGGQTFVQTSYLQQPQVPAPAPTTSPSLLFANRRQSSSVDRAAPPAALTIETNAAAGPIANGGSTRLSATNRYFTNSDVPRTYFTPGAAFRQQPSNQQQYVSQPPQQTATSTAQAAAYEEEYGVSPLTPSTGR